MTYKRRAYLIRFHDFLPQLPVVVLYFRAYNSRFRLRRSVAYLVKVVLRIHRSGIRRELDRFPVDHVASVAVRLVKTEIVSFLYA